MSSLSDRFKFDENGVAENRVNRASSTLFNVEDRENHHLERKLRVWKKTGQSIDQDIKALSLHAIRQAEKVRGFKSANELIVNVLEFVEDENEYGILLEDRGGPISAISASRLQKWRISLVSAGARAVFWQNILRISKSIDLLHSAGIIHGCLDESCIFTENIDEDDYRLSGLERSRDLTSNFNTEKLNKRDDGHFDIFSFREDWRSLGNICVRLLGVSANTLAEIDDNGQTFNLHVSERRLISKLLLPPEYSIFDSTTIVYDGITTASGMNDVRMVPLFRVLPLKETGLKNFIV